MSNLSGINLAMQTSMSEDGSIDHACREALTDINIEAGVQGLVLGSGTGQLPYLIKEECNKFYGIGARRIDGRCDLICQSFALNVDEVIERSRRAEYLGGFEADNGLFDIYRDIDDAVEIDIIGYNIPQKNRCGYYNRAFNYIASVKAAARLRGFDGGSARRPLMPLNAAEEKTWPQLWSH